MKASLKKIVGMTVLGMTLLANTVPTWAGEKNIPEVTVYSHAAGGGMVGARFSGDTKQRIGCSFTESWGAVALM